MLGGDAFIFLHNDFAVFARNVKFGDLAFQTIRHQFKLDLAFFADMKFIKCKKFAQNLIGRIPQCFQQNRDRHFTATVNAEIQIVFRVEFKIEP